VRTRPRPARGEGKANLARQRRFWTRRAAAWDHGAGTSPGLRQVVERVLAEAAPSSDDEAVDLGCGSGQLALRLAPLVRRVIAVDISEAMIDLLAANADAASVDNVEAVASPIERFDLGPSSVDLVVSNYALHHLRDRDKARLVARAATWLRPGGRLVIGDMMFGRGADRRDREVIASKVAVLARRGPGGWWRIAKNASRYLLRLQERPVPIGAWVDILRRAGLADVRAIPVVSEAAVVRGTKPGPKTQEV